jgi:hypothetical protein
MISTHKSLSEAACTLLKKHVFKQLPEIWQVKIVKTLINEFFVKYPESYDNGILLILSIYYHRINTI